MQSFFSRKQIRFLPAKTSLLVNIAFLVCDFNMNEELNELLKTLNGDPSFATKRECFIERQSFMLKYASGNRPKIYHALA